MFSIRTGEDFSLQEVEKKKKKKKEKEKRKKKKKKKEKKYSTRLQRICFPQEPVKNFSLTLSPLFPGSPLNPLCPFSPAKPRSPWIPEGPSGPGGPLGPAGPGTGIRPPTSPDSPYNRNREPISTHIQWG